ncbi:MAG: hypothetical protein J0L96_11620 [Anaerolineae bacterium]|nr:hypothetical protein [Anaerolineae bacterium]
MEDSDFYSYFLKIILKFIVIIGALIALCYASLFALAGAISKTLSPPTPEMCSPNTENQVSTENINNDQRLELVGHFGGTMQSIFATDSYLYIGFGPEFAVLDVKNPATPQRLGYTVLPDEVTDIYVEGQYAYVATVESGLRIVDISNPLYPIETGAHITSAPINKVIVSKGYAYLLLSACNYGGDFGSTCAGAIQIIDVSNLSNPIQISCHKTTGLPVSMALSGNYAYISNDFWSKSNIAVMDISDPTQVKEITSVDNIFDGEITIINNYIYISNGNLLEIFDISNRESPTKATTLLSSDIVEDKNNIYDFAEVNNYTYINEGIKVLDVSNPVQPLLISSYNFDEDIKDFSFNKNYLFIISEDVIQVVDFANLSLPAKIGEYQSNTSPYDFEVSENRLYTTSGSNDFQIINIFNPKFLFVSGSLSLPEEIKIMETGANEKTFVSGTTVDEDVAYLAIKGLGIQAVDISNPNAPVELSFYPITNEINDIAVDNNNAYITTEDSAFEILKFESGSFNKASSFNIPYYDDIAIGNKFAYILGNGNGLWTVDILPSGVFTIVDFYNLNTSRLYSIETDSEHLYFTTNNGIQIIKLTDEGLPIREPYLVLEDMSFESIMLESNYIYALDDNNLFTLNISNPLQPIIESSYTTTNQIRELVKNGDYIYLSIEENGVSIINVKNPSNLVDAGSYSADHTYGGMAVINHCLYLTSEEEGLIIIDTTNPISPLEITFAIENVSGGITTVENYAYVSNQDNFYILDVANPCQPSLIKRYQIPENSYFNPETSWGWILAVSGNYAFMSDYADENRLWMLDLSTPSNPQKIKYYYPTRSVNRVSRQGNYAYVLQPNGFRVIDITNPMLPTELGSYIDNNTVMRAITLSDNLAYIANSASDEDNKEDILVFDISNPSNPVKIYSYTLSTNLSAWGVAKDENGYLYVATGKDGIFIYKIKE